MDPQYALPSMLPWPAPHSTISNVTLYKTVNGIHPQQVTAQRMDLVWYRHVTFMWRIQHAQRFSQRVMIFLQVLVNGFKTLPLIQVPVAMVRQAIYHLPIVIYSVRGLLIVIQDKFAPLANKLYNLYRWGPNFCN